MDSRLSFLPSPFTTGKDGLDDAYTHGGWAFGYGFYCSVTGGLAILMTRLLGDAAYHGVAGYDDQDTPMEG